MSANTPASPTELTKETYNEANSNKGVGLMSPRFLGLLFTQLFGATNDNILRWLVIGIGKQYIDVNKGGDLLQTESDILAYGTACFVLPYLILAAPAGYLADRFSKKSVIVTCKFSEILIMLLAVLAIHIGSPWFLMTVVALMGGQSALFGPAKLGSIPEILPPNKISAANGVIGMITVIAIVLGTGIGNYLCSPKVTGPFGKDGLMLIATVLVGISVIGWFCSMMISRIKAANPSRSIPWNIVKVTLHDLKVLRQDKMMWRVSLGVMFFWALGTMANLNIDQFAREGLIASQENVTPLLVSLVVGIGVGSILAGLWSGGKVELGILPLGAFGLVIFSMLLFTVDGDLIVNARNTPGTDFTTSYKMACFFLVMLGVSAGLFDVPLQAFVQHRSVPENRGAILAACNFLTFSGMFLISFGYKFLRQDIGTGEPLVSARGVFLLCGLATVPVLIYILVRIPQATIKFMAWLVTHTLYRVRLFNRDRLPLDSGAILAPNHVSWLDAIFLLCTSSRPIRVVVDERFLNSWGGRTLAKIMGVIPLKVTPSGIRTVIKTAREAVTRGEIVCIFPEGRISKSGQLQPFKSVVMEVTRGTEVPIFPVYLDELWGSVFSYSGGRFFWKTPKDLPRRVSIWFGKPIIAPKDIHVIRQAVQDLGAEAVKKRQRYEVSLATNMIRACRKSLFRFKMADSSGATATGGKILMRSLVLRRLLLREVLHADEQYVGILLPPAVGSVIVNGAVALAARSSANLNYTVTTEVMDACIKKAGIKHVLTSRKVMEKIGIEIAAEIVYLDDFKSKVRWSDVLIASLQTFLLPGALLNRLLGLHKISGDEVAGVIFTSGSTGNPKGVMLSHRNVASNVEAIEHVVHLTRDDTILGVLPFFHSFGFTVTLWTLLQLDVRAVYHFSPLDARQIGKLANKWKPTALLATPTFLRSYTKRCKKEDFASLEVVVAGAEKLPTALAQMYEDKFGVRPVEGYGCTELSPLASVNVPATRSHTNHVDCKEGSVGHAIPGVTAKVVDPESFEDLGHNKPGMLMINGPNVMLGYLGQAEDTAKVLRQGWYITGDIAKIDTDGFIYITGRLSRFSKIGGEMIPHVGIEEVLLEIIGDKDGDEVVMAAVTAVPDVRKGERIVVLYRELSKSPEEICKAMSEAGLPNLWIPSTDSFHRVDEIPLLGTGKLDLKHLADVARELYGGAQS